MNAKVAGKQVLVGGYVSRAQAELARSYLANNGVSAVVVSDDAGGAAPHFSLGAHGIALAVPVAEADRARGLLASADVSSYEYRSRTRRTA